MNWTQEAVKAEMDYRIETARRHNAARAVRASRRARWFRRDARTQDQHTLAG